MIRGSSGSAKATAVRLGAEGASVAVNYYSDREANEAGVIAMVAALTAAFAGLGEAGGEVVTDNGKQA